MKRFLLLFCLVTDLCVSYSQPEKRELIKNSFPIEELSRLIMESIISQNDSDSALSREVRQEFFNGSEFFAGKLIQLYDSLLSPEDVKLLSTLFNAPETKKLMRVLTSLTIHMLHSGNDWYESALLSYLDKLYPPSDTTEKVFSYEEAELIKDNPYKFRKDRRSDVAYAEKSSLYNIMYNEKVWVEIDSENINPASDIGFKMKDHEVYAIIMSEENDLDLKELRYSAIYNLFKASDSYEIIHTALRRVNKSEILSMKFNAQVNGSGITYHNYYYSGEPHVIQFSSFCRTIDYEKYKSEMEKLLNGLVIKP